MRKGLSSLKKLLSTIIYDGMIILGIVGAFVSSLIEDLSFVIDHPLLKACKYFMLLLSGISALLRWRAYRPLEIEFSENEWKKLDSGCMQIVLKHKKGMAARCVVFAREGQKFIKYGFLEMIDSNGNFVLSCQKAFPGKVIITK